MTRFAFILKTLSLFCSDRYQVDEFISSNKAELGKLTPAEKREAWTRMKAIKRRTA